MNLPRTSTNQHEQRQNILKVRVASVVRGKNYKGETNMKKLFALMAVTLAFALIGCETEEAKTTLTIRNESGKTLRNAKWQSYGFTEENISGPHITTYYIYTGSKASKEVDEGTGYIFFEANLIKLRTQELIVVDKGKDVTFTFTDNTVVVETANSNNIGPLSGF